MALRIAMALFITVVGAPASVRAQQPASQADDAQSKGAPVVPSGPELPTQSPGPAPASSKNATLNNTGKLDIVRFVDGESARVVKPIPAAKEGFKIEVGKPIDDQALKQELASTGAAANPGDNVQITKVDFENKKIILELNGGTHSHFRLRDHLQIGMGMPYPTTTTTAPGGPPVRGAMLILDYGRPLPSMKPEEVKQALAAFLDFSKDRPVAGNWVETLPPEFKQAIAEKKAIAGMNHDMVLAAMGRPDKKVRERDPDGTETEDWIYGTPPRTTFVTFVGDKVVKVEQFN